MMKFAIPMSVMILPLWAHIAVAAGSVEAGKSLAERWCSSCHQTAPGNTTSDAAPPFPALARDKGNDLGWVRAWLANPHPPMQGINLSRQQIDDIVAYLQTFSSLR